MHIKYDISRNELLKESTELDYALVYRMSEVLLIPGRELKEEHLDEECLEARIFSVSKEYHYYEADGKMKMVLVEEDGDEDRDVIDRKYELTKSIKDMTKKTAVCVRYYLGYDEDGQAYTVLTRLTGLE